MRNYLMVARLDIQRETAKLMAEKGTGIFLIISQKKTAPAPDPTYTGRLDWCCENCFHDL